MSFAEVHEELLASLESALDMGKVLEVFGTLVGVIKAQQCKIDDLDARATESSALAVAAGSKADEVDTKIAQALELIQSAERAAEDKRAGDSDLPAALLRISQLEHNVGDIQGQLEPILTELHGYGEDNSLLDKDDDSMVRSTSFDQVIHDEETITGDRPRTGVARLRGGLRGFREEREGRGGRQ
ncbi:hypothetical protein B484DRAFT_411263 [Ochromonadaceae sp. CCMP2298]|nr:hypothetical protein B484DRAFT_411263 [Ochromonadaceae sp. CCMP2298]